MGQINLTKTPSMFQWNGILLACGAPWNRKNRPFVQVGNTNRDKRVRQARGAGSPFCPGWCYQPGQKDAFCPGCRTPPLLSRPGVPGWEIGTKRVSQPGQIACSVVVKQIKEK